MLLELGQKIKKAFEKLDENLVLDRAAIDAVMRDISLALIRADVPLELVGTLKNLVNEAVKNAPAGANTRKLVRNAVVQGLIQMVDPGKAAFQPKKKEVSVVMFVGLQGSGKTTTIAKYAKFYKSKGFKCGMVCGDTFRAGAFEQLSMNATSIGVPFYGRKDETNPVAIARAGVELFRRDGFDLIILDTSGRHKQSEDLLLEMEQMYQSIQPSPSVFLVMDSTIGQSAKDQAQAFNNKIPIGGVIITKLDGHAKGGGALAAVAATKSPIVFLGNGEGFDSLQSFIPASFVSSLLGEGNITGLMEKMESMDKDKKKTQQVLTNMVSGDFCMEDLKDIFVMMEDAGSMTQMMEMMPGGIGQMFEQAKQRGGGSGDRDISERMQNFLTIIKSMSPSEMKFTKTSAFTEKRLIRLARGAGQTLDTCHALLLTFQKFSRMGPQLKPFLHGGMTTKDLVDYNPLNNPQHRMRPEEMRALQNMLPRGTDTNSIVNMMKQFAAAKKK